MAVNSPKMARTGGPRQTSDTCGTSTNVEEEHRPFSTSSLTMGYPHIIVTGDSIAQGSFAPGGYGAALAQRVSQTDLPEFIGEG
jgi:hypothetical protein